MRETWAMNVEIKKMTDMSKQASASSNSASKKY